MKLGDVPKHNKAKHLIQKIKDLEARLNKGAAAYNELVKIANQAMQLNATAREVGNRAVTALKGIRDNPVDALIIAKGALEALAPEQEVCHTSESTEPNVAPSEVLEAKARGDSDVIGAEADVIT